MFSRIRKVVAGFLIGRARGADIRASRSRVAAVWAKIHQRPARSAALLDLALEDEQRAHELRDLARMINPQFPHEAAANPLQEIDVV